MRFLVSFLDLRLVESARAALCAGTVTGLLAVLAAADAGAVEDGTAAGRQAIVQQGPQLQAGRGAAGAPVAPTFQTIAQSVRTQDYTAEQRRRFRDETGNIVTVRERLQVDANGSSSPDFVLTFLGVEGEPAGSPLHQQWQQTYAQLGAMLVRNASFRVRDLAAASSNYTLHDFGSVARAGRAARRMVVFPNALDKAIWVVDVDQQTHVPLFFAEFDAQMRLFAEAEAVVFTPSVAPLSGASAAGVVALPDFASAKAYLGDPPGLVDPNVGVASEYALDGIDVHANPLNTQQKLVMGYTDGIDQFLVVQAPNTMDPFASLASSVTSKGGSGSLGHTIARFRDPAMSALMFWEGGVSFHVTGRGALQRLDDVAKVLYLQALSSN